MNIVLAVELSCFNSKVDFSFAKNAENRGKCAFWGIANQVSGVISTFSFQLIQAISPQIISSMAEGKLEHSKNLSISSCKISFFLVALFVLPLIININFVLEIWLRKIPDYVPVFCVFVLLIELANNLTRGLGTLVEGKGNIKFPKIWQGFAHLTALPISYVLMSQEHSPIFAYIGIAISIIIFGFVRFYFAWKEVGISACSYCAEMAKVISLVLIVFCVTYFLPYHSLLFRLVVSFLFSTLLMSCGMWFALNKKEKEFAKRVLSRIKEKIFY